MIYIFLASLPWGRVCPAKRGVGERQEKSEMWQVDEFSKISTKKTAAEIAAVNSVSQFILISWILLSIQIGISLQFSGRYREEQFRIVICIRRKILMQPSDIMNFESFKCELKPSFK